MAYTKFFLQRPSRHREKMHLPSKQLNCQKKHAIIIKMLKWEKKLRSYDHLVENIKG